MPVLKVVGHGINGALGYLDDAMVILLVSKDPPDIQDSLVSRRRLDGLSLWDGPSRELSRSGRIRAEGRYDCMSRPHLLLPRRPLFAGLVFSCARGDGAVGPAPVIPLFAPAGET